MEFFEYLPGGLAAVAMVFRMAMFFRTGNNDAYDNNDTVEA